MGHPALAGRRGAADAFHDDGALRITAIEVDHAPLARAANKADRGKAAAIMHDLQDYHISPEEAARIANEAGVQMLAYYHLLPAPDNFLMRRLFAQGVDAVRSDGWTIAEDGSLYTLPLDSKEARVARIDD